MKDSIPTKKTFKSRFKGEWPKTLASFWPFIFPQVNRTVKYHFIGYQKRPWNMNQFWSVSKKKRGWRQNCEVKTSSKWSSKQSKKDCHYISKVQFVTNQPKQEAFRQKENNCLCKLPPHISIFMHKNRVWSILWRNLRLCHSNATLSIPWMITCVLFTSQGYIVDDSKNDTCKGQDSSSSKNTWLYNVTVIVAKVQVLFAMLTIQCCTRQQQKECYHECEPA